MRTGHLGRTDHVRTVGVLAFGLFLATLNASAQTLVLAQPTSPTAVTAPLSLTATVNGYETSDLYNIVQFRAAGSNLLGTAPTVTAATYGECPPPAVATVPAPGSRVKALSDATTSGLPQGGSGFLRPSAGAGDASSKTTTTGTLCVIGSSTSATLSLAAWPLKAGTYVLDAVLVSKLAPSTILLKSNSVTLVVNETVTSGTATTLSLRSSVNPTRVGDNTLLSAAVSPADATGTVTFRDGSTSLGTGTVVAGAATLTTSFATAGSHALTATLNPGSGFAASTAPTVLQTVVLSTTLPAAPTSPVPTQSFEYDANGNKTRVVEAPGQAGFSFSTSTTYDSLQQAVKISDAKSGETLLAYDGLSRLTSVTDPRRLITTTPRSGLGDVTSRVSPDTGGESIAYDAAGRAITRVDSRGVQTTLEYDELGRVTRVSHAQGTLPAHTTAFAYDETGAGFSNGIGRLTSSVWPSGSAQYAYDGLGRLTAYTQRVNAAGGANAATITSVVRYAYDAAGNLTALTYPSGRVLSIAWSNGRATSLTVSPNSTAPAATVVDQLQYTATGALQSWRSFALGQAQSYTIAYDANQRPVRYPLGRMVRDLAYDAAGRVTTYAHYDSTSGVAAPTLDQSFGYDENGRVTRVTANGVTTTYAYDASGNRTTVVTGAVSNAYTTQATSNRLASTSNPARTFGYDAIGNTTADTLLGYAATYDLSGRLASVLRAGVTTSFAYDAEGRRVRKFSSATATSTTIFVYDADARLLGEYDGQGRPLREYLWLDGRLIAVLITPANGDLAASEMHTVHSDHLLAPQVLLDRNNAVRWQWFTEPFGTTAPNANPQGYGAVTLNLRFPGQYADAETGLTYNHWRNYDPSIGRYVQSDPIGLAGGLNTYAYADSNPVLYVDADGTFIVIALPAAGVVAAAAKGAAFGALTDFGMQLVTNGWNLKCINWREVVFAGGLGAATGGMSGMNGVRVLMGSAADVGKAANAAGAGGVITGYAGAVGKVVSGAYGAGRGIGLTTNGLVWTGLRLVGLHMDDVTKGISGTALAMERLIARLIPQQLGPGVAAGAATRAGADDCSCK